MPIPHTFQLDTKSKALSQPFQQLFENDEIFYKTKSKPRTKPYYAFYQGGAMDCWLISHKTKSMKTAVASHNGYTLTTESHWTVLDDVIGVPRGSTISMIVKDSLDYLSLDNNALARERLADASSAPERRLSRNHSLSTFDDIKQEQTSQRRRSTMVKSKSDGRLFEDNAERNKKLSVGSQDMLRLVSDFMSNSSLEDSLQDQEQLDTLFEDESQTKSSLSPYAWEHEVCCDSDTVASHLVSLGETVVQMTQNWLSPRSSCMDMLPSSPTRKSNTRSSFITMAMLNFGSTGSQRHSLTSPISAI
eukprot:m.108699 g.108699  ORF g.108699 m.108699 type:complete len:304 (+) comp27895_c0_seq1:183-1094(+)